MSNPRLLLVFLVLAVCCLPSVALAEPEQLEIPAPQLAPPAEEASEDWLPMPVSVPLRIVEVARDQVGVRYSYGGTNPDGFDCSGLVRYAFKKVGIDLPRTSREMYRQVKPVKREELQPGDLLFFRISKRIRTHVAIYAGDGKFIHAPSAGKDVSYASLSDPYWRKRLVRAGRMIGKVLVGAIIPPASH